MIKQLAPGQCDRQYGSMVSVGYWDFGSAVLVQGKYGRLGKLSSMILLAWRRYTSYSWACSHGHCRKQRYVFILHETCDTASFGTHLGSPFGWEFVHR